MCDFLKPYKQASKTSQVPPPVPKIEIGCLLSKDNLFHHYYEDIREPSNDQLRLFFRFEQNNKCVFSIKTFYIRGDQLILAEILNKNHHQIYSLDKYRNVVR